MKFSLVDMLWNAMWSNAYMPFIFGAIIIMKCILIYLWMFPQKRRRDW